MDNEIRVVYYFTQTNGRAALPALLLCIIIAAILIYKSKDEAYWIERNYMFNGAQMILCFVAAVVMVCAAEKVTSIGNPLGMGCFSEVTCHMNYIPRVDSLCDKEGTRRFSSYQEYQEYYYDMVLNG